MKKQLPRVLILHTGGTFGMSLFPTVLQPLSLAPQELKKRFIQQVPELQNLADCEVDVILNCDSAHIGPPEWVSFAQHIQSRWKSFDGIVILHGTDTLAFTASALSFLLRPCKIPVVITGAQRPLSALRTDARSNLISAVEIAAHGPRSLVTGVTVFFGDKLFQGNRVQKVSAADFQAFDSPHHFPLAIVGTTIRYSQEKLKSISPKPRFSTITNQKVLLFDVTPGFPAQVITRQFLGEVDAIILKVFHSWTAPTHDPHFLEFLKQARDKKVPIIVCTQDKSQHPISNPPRARYASGKPLFQKGCFSAGEMTLECTYVKTLLLLSFADSQIRSTNKVEQLSLFASLWRQEYAREGK